MIKRSVLIISILFLSKHAVAGSAARTGITGSLHDINYVSTSTGYYSQDEYERVCVFCHTPHNAVVPINGVTAPLWNHGSTTKAFAPYQWTLPPNQVIKINVDPLIGPTRICLSCHDGVTAVDGHGSAGSKSGGLPMRANSGRVVNNLQVVHPVGFLYADAMAARPGQLADPDTTSFLSSSPFGADSANSNTFTRVGYTQGTTLIASTLYGGFVTCATCHDVHNTNNAINEPDTATGVVANYFVRAPEQGSALCLSCHIM